MKIIEIGSVPPEYGGVAVHLHRLLPRLEWRGLAHRLFDIGGRPKNTRNVECVPWRRVILRLLREPRAVVHFHNFSLRNIIVFFLLRFRHSTVVTLHNERFADELNSMLYPLRRVLVRMLNTLDMIIVTSEKCRALTAPLGLAPNKIVVLPAFIPPAISKIPQLPSEIASLRRRHKFLVAATAYQIRFHQGVDLYGLDHFVELAGLLVRVGNMDVGLVFLLPTVGDPAYLEKIRRRIEELGIGDSCLIVTEPVREGWTVWKASDLVVRPTSTDGDSLTVREALWCGTPVVASDCVPRDSAVVTFRTRDLHDMYDKTKYVLDNLEMHQRRVENLPLADNAETLIHLYGELQKRGTR